MSKPKTLKWIGARDADGQPLEWFGGVPGGREPIPAMDLDADETAALSEAQWQAINSPQGKRLYEEGKSGSSTANPPSDTSATNATG